MVLDSISRIDILAHRLLQKWSPPTVVYRRVAPCCRPYCGGTVLLLGGDAHCLLCARVAIPGDTLDYEGIAHRAQEAVEAREVEEELMA